MKNSPTPHRRAFAALVPATLMLAAPALAQEVAPATPPPTQTAPAPAAPAPQASANPAPTPLTNGVQASKGIGDPNSATPIAPEAYAQAEEARAARAPAARTAPRAAPRAAARRPAPAAPREAIPAAAPAAAAPATTPAADAPAAAPAPAASAAPTEPAATAPAQTAPDTATTETAATNTATTTTDQPAPIWPWILGALVILAGLAALFLRRRNRVEEYDGVYEEPAAVEPTYVEPVAQTAAEPAMIAPVATVAQTQTQSASQTGRLQPTLLHSSPIAAAAVAAAASSVEDKAEAVEVEAELAEPEAEEVAALTASGQHADRPWLEFAMRPVRAGSTADDALVEIELTVGNSGAVAAQDVRISTFMFADGSASQGEMERLLTDRAGDSEVSPVTIAPGEGTRVDATLSLSKEHLGDEVRTFNPVIVADARYRLADGSEGRTSASFTIGMIGAEDDDLRGIAIHRPHMIDDIEARLHGVPAHA